MKTSRRDFLKVSGLTGIGLASSTVAKSNDVFNEENFKKKGSQHFNMSGYAAPKLETVRIGFIGLGQRGPGAVKRMSKIEGVEIKGLCDIRPEKAEAAKQLLANTAHKPELYSGDKDAWKKMVDRN